MSQPLPPTPCRHCQRLAPRHARGLCQLCYRDPDIRRRFSTLRPTRLPPAPSLPDVPLEIARLPTRHLPGSDGKLDVLIARWAFGLPLFHPADASAG